MCHYSQSLRHHNRLTHLSLIKQSPSSISFSLDIPLKFSKATIRGVKMQQWFAIVLKSHIKQHTSYWKQDFQKTLYNCYYTAQPVHNSVLSISPADGKQSCTSIHQRFFSFCLFNMSAFRVCEGFLEEKLVCLSLVCFLRKWLVSLT